MGLRTDLSYFFLSRSQILTSVKVNNLVLLNVKI